MFLHIFLSSVQLFNFIRLYVERIPVFMIIHRFEPKAFFQFSCVFRKQYKKFQYILPCWLLQIVNGDRGDHESKRRPWEPCCIGAVLMAMPHIEEKFSIPYFPGESKYFTNSTMLNSAKIFLLHSRTFVATEKNISRNIQRKISS